MELGAKLKEAREAKDLTLNDIQQETKIQVRYLQAIEQNNFSIMPGSFYVRAFIKEYATLVGLDPDQLIEEHNSELPATSTDTNVNYTRVQRSRKDTTSTKSPKVFSYLPTIIVALLIVGIVFLVWFLNREIPDDSNPSPDTEQENTSGDEVVLPPGQDTEADEDEENPQGEEENQDEAPVDEEPETPEPTLTVESQGTEGGNPLTTYQFVNTSDEVIVVFESESNHWLEVKNGEGNSLYEAMFQPTESPLEVDMSGEQQLYFRFGEPGNPGDPGALKITINGVVLELPEGYDPVAVQRVRVNIENQE